MGSSSKARVRHCSFGIVTLLLCVACSSSSETSRPNTSAAGSGNVTESQKLSYADAFPESRVRRLDIKISSANWQKMLDDMTDMLGAFGSGQGIMPGNVGTMGGGGAGPMLPPDFAQAGAAFGMPPGSFMARAGSGSIPSDGQAGAFAQNPGGDSAMGQGSVDLIPRTPVYVDCDVTSEDITLAHVGIRFKGNSSLAMPWQQGNWKLPLRLKFDEFEADYPETKNQRFFGFQNLSLSNGQSDQSLLRDKIGAELFARAGLPSSASAFYRVYVDHGEGTTYFGLYAGLELPKEKPFLERFFGSHDGNLYKPDGVGARFQTYDETTLGKENNEDAADYSDVRGLVDALDADRSNPEAWRQGLESRLNVNGFLHWLALNTVAQDWDSYGQMPHNYYLYADPNAANALVYIPWDHSYAFSAGWQALSLGLAEVSDSWPLIRYLMDDPRYAQVYRNFVAQAAAEEYDPAWATARFQAAHDLIKPFVIGEDGENPKYGFVTSEASFDAALAALIAHVQQRQSDVVQFLSE